MGYYFGDHDSYLAREVEGHYARTEQEDEECSECGRWADSCACEEEPSSARPCPPCPPVIALAAGKAAIECSDFGRVRVLGGRLGRWAAMKPDEARFRAIHSAALLAVGGPGAQLQHLNDLRDRAATLFREGRRAEALQAGREHRDALKAATTGLAAYPVLNARQREEQAAERAQEEAQAQLWAARRAAAAAYQNQAAGLI